jgi:dTDP-4-dehydrorhamnose reductase
MSKNNTKILILGASGMLGSIISPLLSKKFSKITNHSLNNTYSCNGDLSNEIKCNAILNSINPEVIINLIALTNVDYCESRPEEAYMINVKTVMNIVNWIKKNTANIYLIQISTDQVYDQDGLNKEYNVNLKNIYASTKRMAEIIALNTYSSILRTNFFGKSHCQNKKSLTDWVYEELKNDQAINAFEDIFFSPLSMNTLAEIIELIIEKKPLGIYNLGSKNGMSKAQFIFKFAEYLNLNISKIKLSKSTESILLKTYRPKYMLMDSNKIENILNINLPTLENEIINCSREYV